MPTKEILKRKNSCTDLPCCVVFLIFILCLIILSIFAFIEGDPNQLLYPTDSQGNLCGTGKYSNRPYLYFFDWTECIPSILFPVNILNGHRSICSTKQVCVEQCPKRTSFYKLRNYKENVICLYDVQIDNIEINDLEEYIRQGKCSSYVINSQPLFGRCIPKQLQQLINSYISVSDIDGTNYTVDDLNGNPLNGSKIEEGVKYLIDVLNLKEIGVFLVEDLLKSWKYLLIGLTLSCLFCFIWIVLMRWLLKPVVWFTIIGFIVSLSLAVGFSFFEFIQLFQKSDQSLIKDFRFVTDAKYYRDLPISWLILGILLSILLIISLLILMVVFKRLRIALAILKESSKAIAWNFFSLFWPIIPFLLELAFISYWVILAIYLSTSGKPIYRFAANETLGNRSTDLQYGNVCDPQQDYSTLIPNYQCVFSEYGYNPVINFGKSMNESGKYFEEFIRFVNQYQWIPQLFSIFMLFWLTSFIIGFSELVLAGVFAQYYWNRERIGIPCSSLFRSLIRSLLFHLGTVALGSLIIAIVKLIRFILEYIQTRLKNKSGRSARCLFCCCRCCLFCLEKFLKFLNRNAYIITAIYGTGFFRSARRAFTIIISNPLRLLVIDRTTGFLIFISKMMITISMGVLSFFFFTKRMPHSNDYVPELNYYFIPILLILCGTYVISTCFFAVYSMAVDTLFICALEDLNQQEKNPKHQMMMPKGLRKVFRVKNK